MFVTFQLALLIFLSTHQEDRARQAQDLADKLRSERIEERDEAARRLKDLGRVALPALQKAANDPDPEVSKRAIFLCNAIKVAETLSPKLKIACPTLVDSLASASTHEWTEIFITLTGAQGLSLNYPQLRREDLDPLAPAAVRGARTAEELKAVCEAVGNRRLRSAATEIIRLFKNPDPLRRSAAVVAYITIQSEADRPELIALLDSKDNQIKELAQSFLEMQGTVDRAAENAKSCEELKHENIQVRAAALQHLSSFGRADHAPMIMPLLKDPWEDVRERAIFALGTLQAKMAVSNILGLCDDPEPRVRRAATLAVGMLGGKDQKINLVKLLGHKDPEVRSMAVDMLVKIGAKETAPEIAKLLDGAAYDPARHKAVRALTDWGVREKAPRMVAFITSDSEDLFTRGEAVRAAGVFGIREAAEVVRDFLNHDPIIGGTDGFQALLQLQGKDAIPWIVDRLKAENYIVRSAVLEALGTLPDPGTKEAILGRLGDVQPEVRLAAAECLVRQGSHTGVPIILEQSYRLLSLNRLRNPLIVKRLEESPAPVVEGSIREIFSQIAQGNGLTLRWPDVEVKRLDITFSRYPEVWRAKDWKSGWAALNDMLLETYSAILEQDQIRIVTRGQAEEFWRSWSANQPGEK